MDLINLLPLNIILRYPPIFQLVYFGFCFLIALIGFRRKMGFWGYLFFSILLSPVLGFIVWIVSDSPITPTTKKPRLQG